MADRNRNDRVSARTSDRIVGMSEEERAELARVMAGQKAGGSSAPGGRGAAPATGGRRTAEEEEAEVAAAALRIAGELQRTERRLLRLEGAASRGRYQTGSGGAPTGRYARLLSRADQLERKLRALR